MCVCRDETQRTQVCRFTHDESLQVKGDRVVPPYDDAFYTNTLVPTSRASGGGQEDRFSSVPPTKKEGKSDENF